MSLVIGQIVVAIFSMISLNELLKAEADKSRVKKALLRGLYITGGFCVLMILYSGGAELGDPTKAPAEAMADRAKNLRMDALRSLFFIGAVFAGFWYYLKGKLKTEYIMAIVGLLILADLWSVDRRYLDDKSWEKEKSYETNNFSPSPADIEILKDKSYYRVYDATENPFTSAKASYFHHSIGGYHAAKLRRFQEVVEWHIAKNDMDIVNMLNVKYYIMADQKTGEKFAQINPDACGNAWFVKEIKMMDNADKEIAELGKITPKNTATIDKRFSKDVEGIAIAYDSSNTITFNTYHPEKLTYTTRAKSPQIAVFSEIYYNDSKGWNAYLDGKKVSHFRCNYMLRGMVVPAGDHKIEFRFEPAIVKTAGTVALVSNVGMYLLLLIGLASLLITRKEKKTEKTS